MTDTRRPTRREFIATVGVTSAAAGTGVGATAARFSDTETTSGTLAAGTWDDGGSATHRVAYASGGALRAVRDGTAPDEYGVTDVDALGPPDPGYDGREYAIPVLDADGTLSLVAADGSVTALPTGETTPESAGDDSTGSSGSLASAAWAGRPRSVYYATGTEIVRVAPGDDAPTVVVTTENGATGVLGAGDVDGDGTTELAFVDGSATVRYLVPGSDGADPTVESTGKSDYGTGGPREIDGDVAMPAVDGSGNLRLLGAGGYTTGSLTSDGPAAKTSVAVRDVDGTDGREIAFVANDGDETLTVLSDVGGANETEALSDDAGDPITADPSLGVH